jgi:hypothetical protein
MKCCRQSTAMLNELSRIVNCGGKAILIENRYRQP